VALTTRAFVLRRDLAVVPGGDPPPPPPPPDDFATRWAVPIILGAANMRVQTTGQRYCLRFVARATGTLQYVYLHVKTEPRGDAQSGNYGEGTTGRTHCTFYRTNADGTPDVAGGQLVAPDVFRIGINSEGLGGTVLDSAPARIDAYTVRVVAGFAVVKGVEYCLVIRNSDVSPTANNFSINNGNTRNPSGSDITAPGALGRNERSAAATDGYHDLDPRENIGWATNFPTGSNSGGTWTFPGGPYSAGSHVPSYIQIIDGVPYGQPHYGAIGSSTSDAQRFQGFPSNKTFTGLGFWVDGTHGGGTLNVYKNAALHQAVAVPSKGAYGVQTVTMNPLAVVPGDYVRVTGNFSALQIPRSFADSKFATVMGLGSSHRVYVESDTQRWAALTLLPGPYDN
jgi:hypothetical protein